MGEGMQFAALATLVGKKNAARYGSRRVTVGAVGWRDGSRYVMGTLSDGTVVLGAPCDFTVARKTRTAGAVDRIEGIATGGPRAPDRSTRIHTEVQYGGVQPNKGDEDA